MIALALIAQLVLPSSGESPILAPQAPPEFTQPGSGSRAPFINVRAAPYFAVGDGVADDTAAWQAALDAAGSRVANSTKAATIVCPAGTYKLTSTLIVQQVFRLTVEAQGGKCVFTWGGNGTAPMWWIKDSAQSTFRGFAVSTTSAAPVAEVFRISNEGGLPAPTGNHFEDLYFDGTTTGIGSCFRGMTGAGGDINNDFHQFVNVRCANYTGKFWMIESTQAHGWQCLDCKAEGNGNGTFAVAGAGTAGSQAPFNWHGGFVFWHTNCDFKLGNPQGITTTISAVGSEKSNRFLCADGPSGALYPVTVMGARVAANGLNADGEMIQFYTPGPLTVISSAFGQAGQDYAKSVRISLVPAAGFSRPFYQFIGTTVVGNLNTQATIFPNTQPTNLEGFSAQTSDTVFVPLDFFTRVTTGRVVLTYSATIATDASLGNSFSITATNGTAFTISSPTNLITGQRLTYTIRNTSGGALGAITWGATFKINATAIAPATGTSRSIEFLYDGVNLVEQFRGALDVPN